MLTCMHAPQAENHTSETLDFRIAGNPLLAWAQGDTSTQNITVEIGQGVDLAHAAILVRLVNATNADLDDARLACLITALPTEQLMTTFTMRPNQVGPAAPSSLFSPQCKVCVLAGMTRFVGCRYLC